MAAVGLHAAGGGGEWATGSRCKWEGPVAPSTAGNALRHADGTLTGRYRRKSTVWNRPTAESKPRCGAKLLTPRRRCVDGMSNASSSVSLRIGSTRRPQRWADARPAMLTKTWHPRPRTQDAERKKQSNDYEIYMHRERLANTDDSRSLLDTFSMSVSSPHIINYTSIQWLRKSMSRLRTWTKVKD